MSSSNIRRQTQYRGGGRIRSSFTDAVRTVRPFEMVARIRHADGSWRWFEASGRPFQTEQGQLRCVIVSRDVSDRVREERPRRGKKNRTRHRLHRRSRLSG